MQGMGEEHGEDGMALREGGSGQPQAPAQWPQPGLSPRPRVFLCRSDCEPDARPLCRVSENSPAPTAPPPWAWALSSLEQTFTAWLGLVSIRVEARGKQSRREASRRTAIQHRP